MNIPALTIVPAGAGSGKTHKIQTTLAKWISDKSVAADRIVAVTFTETAAAELRGRIRAELINQNRIDDALKLDQAYISTIHGFGLRLLTEFAFEAGMSPSPRLLNEDEEGMLIRRGMSRTEKADLILGDLSAYGYTYDFNSGKSAEQIFRDTILSLIAKLRSIGRSSADSGLAVLAIKKITKLYGPTRPAEELKKTLLAAIIRLLKKFPEDLSPDCSVISARNKLRSNFCDFKSAVNGTALDHDWELWECLRDLRCKSTSKAPLPPGYEALAEGIKEAADALLVHPGPLKHAISHVEFLIGASEDCLAGYGKDKHENGLVDFTDMLALAFELIQKKKDVLATLSSRMDCLVIDEFQDTNPLQFLLLRMLTNAGVPTLIVGDLKQAIMKVQHADPRLMEMLQEKHPEFLNPLKENWRSTPALMKWVNKTAKGLFGSEYTELSPMADFPSTLKPLEIIDFPERGNKETRSQHAMLRIWKLLSDRTQKVYDKKLRKQRSIKAGDIAVLCPTNDRLKTYAEALRGLGIKTKIQKDGWFGAREVQIAYHALSFVADPSDSHAALYLSLTELGQSNLEEALKTYLSKREIADPILQPLREVIGNSEDKTVEVLVREVIRALGLFEKTSIWPDAEQARVNILRLQGEAGEFLGANREALASGGYYGSGLKTFLAWLAERAKRDDSQPEPSAVDEDAVNFMTWHSAKGREWPVVAVCSMDYKPTIRLPNTQVVYDSFDNLDKVLQKAWIEISPAFSAPEIEERFSAQLKADCDKDASRLLYVALTRAREKLILEWPQYLDPEKDASYWSRMVNATGMELKKDKIVVDGAEFDCVVTPAGKTTPLEYTQETQPENKLPVIGRRALKKEDIPRNLTPEAIVPSEHHGEGDAASKSLKLETIDYNSGLELDSSLKPFERGKILHTCFEVLSGNAGRMTQIEAITGYKLSDEERNSVGKSVKIFDKLLLERFKPVSMTTEEPFLALNEKGSVISGVMDLLVETEKGFWVIDHKSDMTDDLDDRLNHYLPQVQLYAEAVRKARPEKPVLGAAINWITYGKMTFINM